jgi:hypothetical protein
LAASIKAANTKYDKKGNEIIGSIPQQYFQLLADDDRLRGERSTLETKLTGLIKAAKDTKNSLPMKKYTGDQHVIGVEGLPADDVVSPAAGSPSQTSSSLADSVQSDVGAQSAGSHLSATTDLIFHTFVYVPGPGIGSSDVVAIVGDFNEWNASSDAMHWEDGAFRATLKLPAGTHHYKFRLNGSKSVTDPKADAKLNEPDGFGGHNSGVLLVHESAEGAANPPTNPPPVPKGTPAVKLPPPPALPNGQSMFED